MTIPDELVRAAAEALDADDAPAWWWGEGPLQDAGVDSTLAASIALRAAFAKLPECEAAELVGGKALVDHYANSWQTFHHEPSVASVVIAALAREFGGQE